MYEPKNGYVIAIAKKEGVVSKGGILLATQARKLNKTLEVVATDSDIVKVGDKIVIDITSGSIIESNDEGDTIAVRADEIIATC